MKKLLLIATGGTIASKYTESGLSPQISASELLSYVPSVTEFCEIRYSRSAWTAQMSAPPNGWSLPR